VNLNWKLAKKVIFKEKKFDLIANKSIKYIEKGKCRSDNIKQYISFNEKYRSRSANERIDSNLSLVVKSYIDILVKYLIFVYNYCFNHFYVQND
jgi:hypothetical protein